MRIALTHTTYFKAENAHFAVEPANLLGMQHKLIRSGIECRIFHGTLLSREELLGQIRQYNPDLAGMSASKEFSEDLSLWRDFCTELRNEGIGTIFGGMGPTADTAGFANNIAPDVVVRGEGEPVLDVFHKKGFNWSALQREKIFQGKIGDTLIFGFDPNKAPRVKLDSLDYHRDYELDSYEFFGWPYLQIGCPAHCIFCPGDKKIRYKSPQAALSEIGYLISEKHARIIQPLGPDFTTGARQAAAIIESIIKERFAPRAVYKFTVRLDTLWHSLKKYDAVWRSFVSEAPFVIFNTGIESFIPSKRFRLGKDFTMERAERFPLAADKCLEWCESFANAMIESHFIMLDPGSTFEEVERDLDQIEFRLNRFPRHFRIVPELLHSYLQPAEGTKSKELFPTNIEAFGFPNENRLFLLLIYFQNAIERDYAEILKAGIGNEAKPTIDLIHKIKAIINKLKRIKEADFIAVTEKVINETLGRGDLSYFDEV